VTPIYLIEIPITTDCDPSVLLDLAIEMGEQVAATATEYGDGDDATVDEQEILVRPAGLTSLERELLAALEGLLDPTHQCEACDNSRELTGGCTRWAQVRAAVAQAKGLESEAAWEEWTTSLYAKAKAGGA